MRQGSPSRRPRSRGNGKRHAPQKNQNFESNGPEVKVRGTAQQVFEKYLNLARDSSSSGDRIAAEGYYQFAEHYFRLANTDANAEAHTGARQEANTPAGGPMPISQGKDATSRLASAPDSPVGAADQAHPSQPSQPSQPAPAEEQPASETSEDTADESSQEPVQA